MAQEPVPVVLAIVVAAAKQVPPRRVPLPQPTSGRRPLPDHVEGRRPQLALLVRGVGQGKVLGLGVQTHDGAGASDARCPRHHQFPNLARPDGGHGHGLLVVAPDRTRAAVQPLGDCRAAGEQADISRGASDRGVAFDAVASFRSRTAAKLLPRTCRWIRFCSLNSIVDGGVSEGVVGNLQSRVAAAAILEIAPIDAVESRERKRKV